MCQDKALESNWQHVVMQQEQKLLKKESRIALIDPRDPFTLFQVDEFQILSVVLGRNGWIYDQCFFTTEYGTIDNFCRLKRDQIITIAPKLWLKEYVEQKNQIYYALQFRLADNEEELMNLQNYVKNYDSIRWRKMKAKLNQLDIVNKARALLSEYRMICGKGEPMLQTRVLRHYSRDKLNECNNVIKEGSIDPLMRHALRDCEIESLYGYNAKLIGNVIMIGVCYFYDWHEVHEVDYSNEVDGFCVEITDDENQLSQFRAAFPIVWRVKRLSADDNYLWKKSLREGGDKLKNDNGRQKKYHQMKITYDGGLFHRAKDDLLEIVRNENVEQWMDEKQLTLWYGVKDDDKLHDVRRLKKEVKRLQQLLQQQQ